jgi:hypothetical protein
MREIFKSGSVGRAPGNRCLYLENDLQCLFVNMFRKGYLRSGRRYQVNIIFRINNIIIIMVCFIGGYQS